MATKVKLTGKGKEFVFKTGGAALTKYPWNEWLNGDLLMLERSTMRTTGANDPKTGKALLEAVPGEERDYDVETEAMIGKLKFAARKRYKVVQVSRFDEHGKKLTNALIIKARPMTDDEKEAEDLRRAEEKANRKAKEDNGGAAESNGSAPAGRAPQAAAI